MENTFEELQKITDKLNYLAGAIVGYHSVQRRIEATYTGLERMNEEDILRSDFEDTVECTALGIADNLESLKKKIRASLPKPDSTPELEEVVQLLTAPGHPAFAVIVALEPYAKQPATLDYLESIACPEYGFYIRATGYNIADAFDTMRKTAVSMIKAPAEIVQEKYHTLRTDYQTMLRRLAIPYEDKTTAAHERLRYPRFN